MMLEIPSDRPFTVERSGKMSLTIVSMGAELKFFLEHPYRDVACVTLSPAEAVRIGRYLMTAGGPEGSRSECTIPDATIVEGGTKDSIDVYTGGAHVSVVSREGKADV